MKKMFVTLLPLLFLLMSAGCKSDSGGGGTDPFGGPGGGGGGGGVTTTVAVVHDAQNQNFFEFKPSTGVVVTSISAKCAALNLNQTIPNAGTDVYTAANPFYVGPVTVDLVTGHVWAFTITGKVGSTTGTAFTSNVNYTVP